MRPSISLPLAIFAGVAACVSYPEPDIQAPQTAYAAIAPGEAVTVLGTSQTYEQSRITQCVHRAMREAEPGLKIMPGSKFRDALFPWFEPTLVPANANELAALLARPAVKRRVEELAIRYVVVAAGSTTEKNEGFFFCGGGGPGAACLGFSSQDRKSTMTAAIWDLKQGTSAGQLTAKTTGTNVSIGVLVPIFFFSATETAACEGLGKRLAQYVTGKSPAPD